MKKRYLIALLVLILLSSIPAITSAGSWNGWIYQDPYPTSLNLFDIKFVTPLKGWITGKYGSIFYTEDGGDTWELQESGTEEDIMRVAFVNEKTGWAAGERGTIIHTEDGGKAWVKQYNIKALPTKIFFLNEKEGWVTGSTPIGVVYHTKDSGKTWEKVDTGISRAIASVYFNNSQTGWILAGEDVYRTTDGGKKWEKSKLPLSAPPMSRLPERRLTPGTFGISPMGEGLGLTWWQGDIAFANEKQGWAVVNQWYVFHTEDGGKTWAAQLDTGSMSYGFSHISLRDAQNGCVSGSTIYCTEDGGRTWQEQLGVGPGGSKELGGISLTGPSAGWVVGNVGRIMKTEDNSRSWKDPLKGNQCGQVPFFINKKTGWLYSPLSYNRICRTDDGGHNWEKQDVGIKVKNVFFVDDSTGWAVGTIEEWKDGKVSNASYNLINVWGVIKHTTDGGKTWATQFKELMEKKHYLGLSAVTFINPSIGWVAGKKGTILHTEDGGKHWEHQKSADVKDSLRGIHFINSKTGWIVGTQFGDYWTGIVLYTEDGGIHWKVQHKLRDVSFDGLYFRSKKSGWIVGGTEGEAGVLLHTEDGGKTWSEKRFETIGYSRLSFLDKERGVIYSENGFILTTNDGGKTWTKRRVPLKKNPWHFSEIFEKR